MMMMMMVDLFLRLVALHDFHFFEDYNRSVRWLGEKRCAALQIRTATKFNLRKRDDLLSAQELP